MNYKICSIYKNKRYDLQLLYGSHINFDILFARYIGNNIRYFSYDSLSNLYYMYGIYYPYTTISYSYYQSTLTLFMN